MLYNKFKIKKVIILLIFVLFLSGFIQGSISYAEIEVIEAPLNPEFIKYLEGIDNPQYDSFSFRNHGMGLIPDSIKVEKDPNFIPTQLKSVKFPKKFDLRKQNKLTSVKDQGRSNSCWSFATYGSLESSLMPSAEWNFSENHLKNTHGFDYKHDDGGNRTISTAYLTRWSGPVLETEDPFKEYDGNSSEVLPIQKQIKDVLFLPDRLNSLDNDYIKWALMEYGAVQSSYYENSNFFKTETNSYYYNSTNKTTNHAIAIVGWDDNYSKDNFNRIPSGDGAFIIKNSWGEDWAENGYFYISYYDIHIGTRNAVYINAEDNGHYDNIYQYDQLGHISNLGLGGKDTNWFANVFESNDDEENLVAVSFYTSVENAKYEIFVDTNCEGEKFNNLKKVKEGALEIPGYHTIDFEKELIKPGEIFTVAVKLTTPNYKFPIPLERRMEGYTSKASSNEGESYVSSDGIHWRDLTTGITDSVGNYTYKNANVNLKAFTRNARIVLESILFDESEIFLLPKQKRKLLVNILPADATNKEVVWSSSNEKVALVSKDGVITAISEGQSLIKATSVENKDIFAETRVTISKYPISIKGIRLSGKRASVDLHSTNEEGVVIVQAFDEDNRILELKYLNLEKFNDNYSFEFNTSKNISYIKVYIWDSLNNMIPIAEVNQIN